MTLYRLLNRLPFPRGYVAKVLLVCFLGTHAPLVAFAACALLTLPFDGAVARLALLILFATLGGTGATLLLVRGLLAPIVAAQRALKAYLADGARPALPTGFTDEAGLLLAEIQHVVDHLDATLAELDHQASTDPLTAVGNRRWLAQEAAGLFAPARANVGIAAIVFDIDHFKRINDHHGHAVGDNVLAEVAAAVRAELRSGDRLARTGGEEFCIQLPHGDARQGAALAERLRTRVEGQSFAGLPVGAVTVSFGVAATASPAENLPNLIAAADERLYAAKRNGRNCVCADMAAAMDAVA